LNVTQNRIARIELEKMEPEIPLLRKISMIFGVNLNWLIKGEGSFFSDGSNEYKPIVPAENTILEKIIVCVERLLPEINIEKRARIIGYYYFYLKTANQESVSVENEIINTIDIVSKAQGVSYDVY
jgi:transcriptional regulator with XRE-family HTH domain